MKFSKALLISTSLTFMPMMTFAAATADPIVELEQAVNGLKPATVAALRDVGVGSEFNWVTASRNCAKDALRKTYIDSIFAAATAMYNSGLSNARTAFANERTTIIGFYENAANSRVTTRPTPLVLNMDLLQQTQSGVLIHSEKAPNSPQTIWELLREAYMQNMLSLPDLESAKADKAKSKMREEGQMVLAMLSGVIGMIEAEVTDLNNDLNRVEEEARKTRAAKKLALAEDRSAVEAEVSAIQAALKASEEARNAREALITEKLVAPGQGGSRMFGATRESFVVSTFNPQVTPEIVAAVLESAKIYLRPVTTEDTVSNERNLQDYNTILEILFKPLEISAPVAAPAVTASVAAPTATTPTAQEGGGLFGRWFGGRAPALSTIVEAPAPAAAPAVFVTAPEAGTSALTEVVPVAATVSVDPHAELRAEIARLTKASEPGQENRKRNQAELARKQAELAALEAAGGTV